MFRFDVVPAGDSALHVQLPERIDPQVNGYCVALARIIRDRVGASIRDVLIGYCSVTIYFDPLALDPRWLEHQIRSFADSIDDVEESEGGLVEVPVSYGGQYGPDIADVAALRRNHRGGGRRAAHRARLSCLSRRLRARLCLSRRSRPAHRRPASSHTTDAGACRIGRHRRRTDRHLSISHTRRLEHHRADALCFRSIRRVTSPSCSSPATASGSLPSDLSPHASADRPSSRNADHGPGFGPLGTPGQRCPGGRSDGRLLTRGRQPAGRQ